MGNVRRVFVEKRQGFNVEAQALLADLQENLGLTSLTEVRIFQRYDLSGLNDQEFAGARDSVLSEPNCDDVYEENLPSLDGIFFAVEYLPGQYDQRADSAAQCIQLLTQGERPLVRSARVYVLTGKSLNDQELARVKSHLINPVESREASMAKPDSLELAANVPADIPPMHGFLTLTQEEIRDLTKKMGLAMSSADLAFCQEYFRDQEKREPTLTEIKVIDTYWSDHCRHTTFLTKLDEVEFEESPLNSPAKTDYTRYLKIRKGLGRENKDICLMDLATIGARELKRQGLLDNLDASDEINACSIVVEAEIDGKTEPWLIMFKNETHNHPTEIEPFGGAATCLGGAIRDPLSGRSYVYQAMRITGAGDPRKPLSETLPGKLPQRRLTRTAAAGYSSYGNQIGLATGKVQEIYHEGFVAKRLELGAVIAAAPQANVLRGVPSPGDVILLIGGRTGRDGCGGATGSSKAHTGESLQTCGAEVQKGNPLTERNIQRLFRRGEFARLVKRCNDFGAGGVCVAIGELAPGLKVNLDLVPKKYDGLDGTELAISESQERMAVVVAAGDVQKALDLSAEENLEATAVAEVTASPRLVLSWRGRTIVDLSREFLDTNGVTQHARAHVDAPSMLSCPLRVAVPSDASACKKQWLKTLGDLNVCSQQGLVERFDGSIGAATVISPFGGKLRLTPNEAMAAKIPVPGHTETCTLMSHGYNPDLSTWSPYHGALYAVIEANAKIAAAGGDVSQVRMSFQEYFERLGERPASWGKTLAALLGGLRGQLEFGTASIGGKDSMSGTFEHISVPPTLVAFAVGVTDASLVTSPEFKKVGSVVSVLETTYGADGMPDFDRLRENFDNLRRWHKEGKILAAQTIGFGGLAAALAKMCFGNWIGVNVEAQPGLFDLNYGSIVLETKEALPGTRILGATVANPEIVCGDCHLTLDEALAAWKAPLENVFPSVAKTSPAPVWQPCQERSALHPRQKTAKPRVLIPVFPGTNCEYDTAKAFALAGAEPQIVLVRNLSAEMIEDSVKELVKAIDNAQIVAFPGGFSGGDEPDGSGKFIATTFRNPRIAEAMMRLLKDRDGLALGICNGFQALIKLGLVPFGEIRPCLQHDDPTLTFNTIGRHAATYVNTVVASVKSPWLRHAEVGQVHSVAISHGEGRFQATPEQVKQLLANGQVAFQYAGPDGLPATDAKWNPNGSVAAIEGITSPDGRVLGKMGHSERSLDSHIAINVPGEKDQGIFRSGVEYFA